MACQSIAPEHALRELCRALDLPYELAQWGKVNADARRLREFVAYYEAHPSLCEVQRREMLELILASANEHLSSGAASLPAAVPQFLLRNQRTFRDQLLRWSGLGDRVQFPVARWLREHLQLVPNQTSD
ncbi:MAG TPA: hypothetical protein VJR89_23775 [Polyangiales bacterium]|nr:hypothetical protein [Polyangiales bacterium]